MLFEFLAYLVAFFIMLSLFGLGLMVFLEGAVEQYDRVAAVRRRYRSMRRR
jgi:hypothetical protein